MSSHSETQVFERVNDNVIITHGQQQLVTDDVIMTQADDIALAVTACDRRQFQDTAADNDGTPDEKQLYVQLIQTDTTGSADTQSSIVCNTDALSTNAQQLTLTIAETNNRGDNSKLMYNNLIFNYVEQQCLLFAHEANNGVNCGWCLSQLCNTSLLILLYLYFINEL